MSDQPSQQHLRFPNLLVTETEPATAPPTELPSRQSLFNKGAALARSGKRRGNWYQNMVRNDKQKSTITVQLLYAQGPNFPLDILGISIAYDEPQTFELEGKQGTYKRFGAASVRSTLSDGTATFDTIAYGHGKRPDGQALRNCQLPNATGIMNWLIESCTPVDTQDQLSQAAAQLGRLITPAVTFSRSSIDAPTSNAS